MVALSRNLGRKKAMELLTLGRLMSAEEARQAGLVNDVVAAEALTEATRTVASTLAQKSRAVLALGKKAFYEQLSMPLERGLPAHLAGHRRQHDDGRRARGHLRLSREAQTSVAGHLKRMEHDSYSADYIRDILTSVRTIALVGASSNTVRPSYFVLKYLIDKGYEVFPVNPGTAGKEILGRMVYGNLKDIPVPIDMVDIFRNSAAAGPVVDEALSLDPLPKVIWMQLTVRNDEAAARAEEKGVKVVMNRCPKMEYGKLSGEWGWVGGNSGVLSSRRQTLHASGKLQSLGLNPTKG